MDYVEDRSSIYGLKKRLQEIGSVMDDSCFSPLICVQPNCSPRSVTSVHRVNVTEVGLSSLAVAISCVRVVEREFFFCICFVRRGCCETQLLCVISISLTPEHNRLLVKMETEGRKSFRELFLTFSALRHSDDDGTSRAECVSLSQSYSWMLKCVVPVSWWSVG